MQIRKKRRGENNENAPGVREKETAHRRPGSTPTPTPPEPNVSFDRSHPSDPKPNGPPPVPRSKLWAANNDVLRAEVIGPRTYFSGPGSYGVRSLSVLLPGSEKKCMHYVIELSTTDETEAEVEIAVDVDDDAKADPGQPSPKRTKPEGIMTSVKSSPSPESVSTPGPGPFKLIQQRQAPT
ncbi:hypothetical protein GALMADRAFT_144107 [Galerina marginata CBS 339.88]|uniref:Uncharacterized protein n=1 Tax=Galerina marginata (strain CBS 339.88) TaxID=685588 RepID=A0A067SLY4_GALM3|nr:hypothetical protein GALMADRAFT_144107 [Galerina marginata CBS 339.88]